MRVISNSLLVILFVSLSISGCTTCHEKTVSTRTQGIWNADVRHRICGSYSGYGVVVYKVGEQPPDYGDGDKELFQAVYKTEDYIQGAIPVSVEWRAEDNLVVHHVTRLNVDDDKSKPMIIKAEGSYKDISIKYHPEPIIWDKHQ